MSSVINPAFDAFVKTWGYDDGRYLAGPWFFPRQGEVWIGSLGLFFSRDLWGIELPNGKFIGRARV